jgi:hypothetical protein
LYDLRNRFYSPDLGRFLQPDPIGFAGDPSNIYRYVGNNPVNRSDPSGLVSPDYTKYSTEQLQAAFPDLAGIPTVQGVTVVGTPVDVIGMSNALGGLGASGGERGGSGGGGREGGGDKDKAKEKEQKKDPCADAPAAPQGVDVNQNIREAKMSDVLLSLGEILSFDVLGAAHWGFAYTAYTQGGTWSYLQSPYNGQFGDFANFNYGATGRALGFSSTTLEREAGRNHEREGYPGEGSAGFPPFSGQPPYGNDWRNYNMILRGIAYFDADCYEK